MSKGKKIEDKEWKDKLDQWLSMRSAAQKNADRLKQLELLQEIAEKQQAIRDALIKRKKLIQDLEQREKEYQEILRIQEMLGDIDATDRGRSEE